MKVSFLLLGLLLSLAGSASAQKSAVAIQCVAEDGDTIGVRFCSALRDAVAVSPRFQNVSIGAKELHLAIRIVTTACWGDLKDSCSAQSVTFTWFDRAGDEYYLSSSVLLTGKNHIKDQAEAVLASLDYNN